MNILMLTPELCNSDGLRNTSQNTHLFFVCIEKLLLNVQSVSIGLWCTYILNLYPMTIASKTAVR